jgi:hypothetical protein
MFDPRSLVRATSALLVVIAYPVSAQSASTSRYTSVAGCYVLTLGPWSGPFPSNMPEGHKPPRVFRLSVAGSDTAGDGKIHTTVTPNPPVFGKFRPAWGLRAPDSVRVSWSTGFVGVILDLVGNGDTLRGRARAFTDLELPEIVQPSAPAMAVRTVCPASLR